MTASVRWPLGRRLGEGAGLGTRWGHWLQHYGARCPPPPPNHLDLAVWWLLLCEMVGPPTGTCANVQGSHPVCLLVCIIK